VDPQYLDMFVISRVPLTEVRSARTEWKRGIAAGICLSLLAGNLSATEPANEVGDLGEVVGSVGGVLDGLFGSPKEVHAPADASAPATEPPAEETPLASETPPPAGAASDAEVTDLLNDIQAPSPMAIDTLEPLPPSSKTAETLPEPAATPPPRETPERVAEPQAPSPPPAAAKAARIVEQTQAAEQPQPLPAQPVASLSPAPDATLGDTVQPLRLPDRLKAPVAETPSSYRAATAVPPVLDAIPLPAETTPEVGPATHVLDAVSTLEEQLAKRVVLPKFPLEDLNKFPAASEVQPAALSPKPADPVAMLDEQTILSKVARSPVVIAASDTKDPLLSPVIPVLGLTAPPGEAHLSATTKALFKNIPAALDTVPETSHVPIGIQRATEHLSYFDPNAPKPAAGETLGSVVEVRSDEISTYETLQKAYDALMAGQRESAAALYRTILKADAKNIHALFGLATTYQKDGRRDEARDYYQQLLAIQPTHRDALNNLLVLASEESPQQTLEELAMLAQRNPDFSPIPAQMAMILNKLGKPDEAVKYMAKAIRLAPDNLLYRYNLAIILDRSQHYAQAAKMYRELLSAAERNSLTLPAPEDVIHRRLTFLESKLAS
jgi:Tfp pilus assembly protein PilF